MTENLTKLTKENTNKENRTRQIMHILEEGRDELPTIPKKERSEAFSEKKREAYYNKDKTRETKITSKHTKP